MELPLIYKYQPKLLNDFQMNEETLHLLKTMINMNTLNILFIGDSGVGKTSLINAIIYDYYNGQFKEENILSINSLKEQGISYYRNEVKTFCQSSSLIVGKKKILLLDDLDIINEQRHQVFRNCIDKYSDNVHFIASCSNPHKVIDGLQSRMMIIKLHPLNLEHLGKIVNKICSYENIHLTNEAEKFLLSISNNSIRIVINYLEKCKLLNCEINVELLDAVCTNIAFQDFTNYTNLCKNEKNIQQAVVLIYKLFDRGYSVMDILDNYFLFVKTTNMLTDDEKYKIIPYICKYITIFHNVHEDEIELAFFTNNLINIFS